MGRLHRKKKSGFLSYLNKQKDLAKLIPTSFTASPWLVPRFPWPLKQLEGKCSPFSLQAISPTDILCQAPSGILMASPHLERSLSHHPASRTSYMVVCCSCSPYYALGTSLPCCFNLVMQQTAGV